MNIKCILGRGTAKAQKTERMWPLFGKHPRVQTGTGVEEQREWWPWGRLRTEASWEPSEHQTEESGFTPTFNGNNWLEVTSFIQSPSTYLLLPRGTGYWNTLVERTLPCRQGDCCVTGTKEEVYLHPRDNAVMEVSTKRQGAQRRSSWPRLGRSRREFRFKPSPLAR